MGRISRGNAVVVRPLNSVVRGPMSRMVALALGVANAIPIMYIAFFMFIVFSSMSSGSTNEVVPFETLFVVHLGMMGLILALTVLYLVVAYRSPAVPNDKRSFWAIVIFMGNVLAFPFFWYFFVWKPTTGNGSHEQ